MSFHRTSMRPRGASARRGSRNRVALLSVLAAVSLTIAGCQVPAAPAADDHAPTGAHVPGTQEPVHGMPLEMPEECEGVAIGWYPGVDIADVELMPGDWPAPPDGSTLCSTAGGGSSETATYAAPLAIDDIFAHYESRFPADVDSTRSSGADNGTGYETIDGTYGDAAFQIRRTDGGFTLYFGEG